MSNNDLTTRLEHRIEEYKQLKNRIRQTPPNHYFRGIPSPKKEEEKEGESAGIGGLILGSIIVVVVLLNLGLTMKIAVIVTIVLMVLLGGVSLYFDRKSNDKRLYHNGMVSSRKRAAVDKWIEEEKPVQRKAKMTDIYIIQTLSGRLESLAERLKYYKNYTTTESAFLRIADIPLEDYQLWALKDFMKGNDVADVLQFVDNRLKLLLDERLHTKPQKLEQATKEALSLYEQKHLSKVATRGFFLNGFNIIVPFKLRAAHGYILASSGSGKSELMKLFMYHDLSHSSSTFVIDPDDKLSLEVSRLKYFHENPDQLIYLSPKLYKTMGASFKYNPLDHKYHRHPHGIKLNEIRKKIDRLSEAFGVIMEGDFTEPQKDVIEHALSLLMLQKGRHLGDFMRLIHPTKEPPKELLAPLYNMPDIPEYENLKNYFSDIFFEDYTKQSKNKLFARFNRVFGVGTLRRILYTPQSSFDLQDALESGKTVCVGLSELGETEQPILGAFFISEMMYTTYQRPVDETLKKRKQIFCYIDEFQEFMHKDFKKMLPAVRKRKVAFMLAHQHYSQLDSKMRDAVLGNTEVKFCGKGKDIKDLAGRMGFTNEQIKRSTPKLGNGCFMYQAGGISPQLIQGHNFLAKDLNDPQFYMNSQEFEAVLNYQIENYYVIEKRNDTNVELENQAQQEPTEPKPTPKTKTDNGFTPDFHDIDL